MRKALQPYFLLVALSGCAVLAFFILQPFLAPLVLAAVFAVVLKPGYSFIRVRIGERESLASLATAVLFTAVVMLPSFLIGSQLVSEAQDLYQSFSDGDANERLSALVSSLGGVIEPIVPGVDARLQEASTHIGEYARNSLTWGLAHLGVAFTSIFSLALDIFIFFVSLYFLLRDGRHLTDRLVELSPLPDRDDSLILSRLEDAVNSVIKGQLTIAVVQGFLTGVGFTLFGVPSAILWGSVAAIAALIPSVGTALIIAPAVLYLALTGSVIAAIGLAIWGVVAVGLVDNLLGPKLISAGLRLHPLLVILAVIGGIAFFGPIGIFLGPLTMSLLFVLLSIYAEVTRRTDEKLSVIE